MIRLFLETVKFFNPFGRLKYVGDVFFVTERLDTSMWCPENTQLFWKETLDCTSSAALTATGGFTGQTAPEPAVFSLVVISD